MFVNDWYWHKIEKGVLFLLFYDSNQKTKELAVFCFCFAFAMIFNKNRHTAMRFSIVYDYYWNAIEKAMIFLFAFEMIGIPPSSDWRGWLQLLQSGLDGMQIINKLENA